ncbi:DUF4349 domain-containing protein [Sphaerimonospora cavernae]|uniref:DUF4349 domain-containing protein n=1 Tax=Sphaerimonospora cavernae TaxID=1740611 RepID=A0ABV6U531_9ACTN
MTRFRYGMRFRYGTAAAAAIMAAVLVSGCGGGADDSAADRAAVPAAVGEAADAGSVAALPGGRDASSTERQSSDRRVDVAADRAIIYTAELTVRAADVPSAADRAKTIVLGAEGYVSQEKSDSHGRDDRAVITFKVPPQRYPDVLAQLGRDLGKRESMHQGTKDVTEEVADVESRVKSARATLDQFRTLLSKANKIGEIMEIEREISNREAELESLQARQKALAAQTGMATITLTLIPQPKPSAKPKKQETQSGFLSGLRVGWRAFVEAIEIGLTVLGVLLPWLVLAAVVWLIVRVITRRFRPRPVPAPPARPQPVAPQPVAPQPYGPQSAEAGQAEQRPGPAGPDSADSDSAG